MRKKNRIIMALVSILLCLVLVTTSLLSGIFARFAVSKSASADIKYKKWGLTVTTGDNLSTSYTKDNALVVDSSSTLDVMAPGTKGSLMWFRVSGSAEVDFAVDFSGSIEIGSGFSPTSGITNEEKVFFLMKMIPEDVETQRLSVISSNSSYRDNPVYSELEFPLEGIKEMVALALTGETIGAGSQTLPNMMMKYREKHNTTSYVTFDNKVLLPIYQDIQNGVYDGRVRSMVNELRVYDETARQTEYFPIQFRYVAYDVTVVNGEEVYTKVDSLTSSPVIVSRTDKTGNKHYFAEGAFDSIAEMETVMSSDAMLGLGMALDEPYKAENTTMDRIYSLEWEWLYHYDTVEEVEAGKTINNRETTASGNYQTPDLDTQLGEAINKYPELFEINLNMSVKLEQVEGLAYKLVNDDGVEKIEFGSYPQSLVEDSDLASTLSTKAGTLPTSANSQNWTSYGYYKSGTNTENYMWYIDVENGADKYRGVYFTDYRPYSYQLGPDESTMREYYTAGEVYWFKYEPITWTILKKSNDEALVLSDMVIDSQAFKDAVSGGGYALDANGNSTGKDAHEYVYSDIRTMLNETFWDTAFSDSQKKTIYTTIIDDAGEGVAYDKIFLLSYDDLKNTEYGFTDDASRQKTCTDYAKMQGAYGSDGIYPYWWLRTPNVANRIQVCYVSYTGGMGKNQKAHMNYTGVVPAIWIKL